MDKIICKHFKNKILIMQRHSDNRERLLSEHILGPYDVINVDKLTDQTVVTLHTGEMTYVVDEYEKH